ncbi:MULTISPECIES: lipopolysaccharide biosynthesis protein [unclassified Oscillibacter]|uniref:lipopolysaccharide biosynthesis protein n=1 Tax=unclassified Oscillibacter TaxID=2629304 RepID=UPI0025DF5133|nr:MULTISPECIES: lipopolysaccharide biosynthesis protein [unclassified Oscillibacter]
MQKIKEVFWNTGGNIIYLAATWLMTVVVVRLANFEAAGVFSLAMTITAVFYCISMFGMRSFQVSDVTGEFSDQVYFSSRIITAAVGMALCFLYCCLSGYSGYQIGVVLLYMLFKTVEAFSDVSYGFFQKYNHFNYIFWSLTAKGIVSILLFSLVLYFAGNLLITLLVMTLGAGAIYAFYDLRHSRRLVDSFLSRDSSQIWKLLSATLLLMAVHLVTPVLIAIPRVYYEAHFGSELFGYYSSISAPTVVISTFVSCAMMPFLPRYAEYQIQQQQKRGYQLLVGTVGFTIVFGGICYLLSLWMGDWALSLLYTPEIVRHAAILPSIVVSTTCSALVMCLNSFFIATRRMKTLMVLLLIGCGASYLFTPFLIEQFAMAGISYTLTVSQCIQAGCMFILACIEIKKWNLPKKENNDVC